MIRRLILAAVLLTGTAAADDCSNAASQADMNACAAASFATADAALNDAYKQITSRLQDDETATALLVTAQKAWVAFRDAECSFQTSAAEGGSIQPMLVSGCMEALTLKRTEALTAYLNCEEGDLSCPVPALVP